MDNVLREPLVYEFTCQRIHGVSGPTTEAKIVLVSSTNIVDAAEEFVKVIKERDESYG